MFKHKHYEDNGVIEDPTDPASRQVHRVADPEPTVTAADWDDTYDNLILVTNEANVSQEWLFIMYSLWLPNSYKHSHCTGDFYSLSVSVTILDLSDF